MIESTPVEMAHGRPIEQSSIGWPEAHHWSTLRFSQPRVAVPVDAWGPISPGIAADPQAGGAPSVVGVAKLDGGRCGQDLAHRVADSRVPLSTVDALPPRPRAKGSGCPRSPSPRPPRARANSRVGQVLGQPSVTRALPIVMPEAREPADRPNCEANSEAGRPRKCSSPGPPWRSSTCRSA